MWWFSRQSVFRSGGGAQGSEAQDCSRFRLCIFDEEANVERPKPDPTHVAKMWSGCPAQSFSSEQDCPRSPKLAVTAREVSNSMASHTKRIEVPQESYPSHFLAPILFEERSNTHGDLGWSFACTME